MGCHPGRIGQLMGKCGPLAGGVWGEEGCVYNFNYITLFICTGIYIFVNDWQVANLKNKNMTIKVKTAGQDEAIEFVNDLSKVVKENWGVIYLGASRLGVAIPRDYYAPERVQIGNTRLHESTGVKYAHGWKYDKVVGPTVAQIEKAVADIQQLIDAGAENLKINLKLAVIKG